MADLQASDEVAEDYKSSLEFLVHNDRYAINNLTVIAKENTAHAEAISRVLEEHIRKAYPQSKLPAIYVLDSIAKNVGTPYTEFLGRNLYSTFMDAYCSVDGPIRKKLVETLKTWREPKAYFPLEITKRIESALIQARTAALNQQNRQSQSQQDLYRRGLTIQQQPPYPSTSTPPQRGGPYQPPPSVGPGHFMNGNTGQQYPQFAPPNPTPPPHQAYAAPNANAYPQVHPHAEIGPLFRDIDYLLGAAQAEFAHNTHDTNVQNKLKALLDLRRILETEQLPPQSMQAIHDQVAQLLRDQVSQPPIAPPPVPTSVTWTAPTPAYVSTPPIVTPYAPPAPPPAPSVAIPSGATIAEILARNNAALAAPSATPSLPLSVPSQPPQTTAHVAAQANGNTSSLLASLRAAGLLPSSASTPNSASVLPGGAALTHLLPPPQSGLAHSAGPLVKKERNGVELTTASLKITRPHLISKLYEARPNQCSTCGKRFLLTEEDRKKKASHLDWHFRTNQRLNDTMQRGQSRSWYVDELEWIRSRGNEEEGTNVQPAGTKDAKTLGAELAAKNDPKSKFIPVPNDAILSSAPCPICQEKFETSWNDDLQDFVWKDAVKIGSRIFHASCHEEMKKDGGNTPRTATPDSVLGKRKAVVPLNTTSPAKVQKQVAA